MIGPVSIKYWSIERIPCDEPEILVPPPISDPRITLFDKSRVPRRKCKGNPAYCVGSVTQPYEWGPGIYADHSATCERVVDRLQIE